MPSKGKVDADFWKRADAHVVLANNQLDKAVDAGQVCASILYAAARFNAFATSSQAPDLATLKAARSDAVKYYTEQFKRMFEDNIDEQIANFDKYFGSQSKRH